MCMYYPIHCKHDLEMIILGHREQFEEKEEPEPELEPQDPLAHKTLAELDELEVCSEISEDAS